jgi:transcriptional regulator with GAF, ATPase, and Fis domain
MQPNNPSAYLIIRQGSRWTDIFRLIPGKPLIIGRASSNEIPVADERSSRKHAEIYFSEDNWFVRDLGSRNGTYLDGSRISAPQPLVPGGQIVVASCRLTFASSLDEVAPMPEADQAAVNPGSQTQEDIPPIALRKSKSSILDPEQLGLGLAESNATLRRQQNEPAQSQIAAELLQLAYDLARESTVATACERALQRLLTTTGCQSGGVLKLEATSEQPIVLAALQLSNKAYHPVPATLVSGVLRDDAAVLARNLASSTPSADTLKDPITGVHRVRSSSQSHMAVATPLVITSVIAAPVRIQGAIVGLLHIYSRDAEPELSSQELEVTLAVADVLGVTLDNLMRQQSLEAKLMTTKHRLTELEQQMGQIGDWIGESKSLLQLREQIKRVGPTNAIVLIRGESGSGKELVARGIHDCSSRSAGPFVALNCAALTSTLLESELFGHEKGAFTGATERKLGKFEQAHGGTLMLDELGEMSLEIQSKFLRVLEGKPFERVGGSKPIQVDVRVVAATNRDLEQAVREGQFRSDLYFRLRVIELRVTPLRERPEDVLPLAQHFLQQFRSRSGHGPNGFSERAKQAMLKYHWPGNVRELRNSVERAFVLAQGQQAEPEDLALSYLQVPGQPAPGQPSEFSGPIAVDPQDDRAEAPRYHEKTIDALEREHIEATLVYTGGQKNRAAAILGIERSTLDRKLKRFG